MMDPGSPVSPRRRGRDDSSWLETRYIPKENKEQAQIKRYDSRCVHGWRVTGRCWETLSFFFFFPTPHAQWSWIRGPAGAGDGVRVRVGELLLLRSPVAPEEVRFALWTPHKSGDCWAERNTPTWSLSAGLPKQFHVTELQTDAHRAYWPPQDTDAGVHVGTFCCGFSSKLSTLYTIKTWLMWSTIT